MTDPDDTRQRTSGALRNLGEAVHDVADEAPAAARREMRRVWPWLVAGNAAVTLVLVLLLLALDTRVGTQGREIDALTAAAEQAKPHGDAANKELVERGQAPVPIPEPGQGADTEVIVATATARVLASIPDLRPTAAQLGAAVAQHMATNPLPGIGPAEVSATLAGYLATNPPPPGPTGPRGEPGADCDPVEVPQCQGPPGRDAPPPTAEQIRAEIAAYIQANPDALCPTGGQLRQVRLQLAGGGAVDAWTCVVTEYPPPTTTTTTTEPPPPSTTPVDSTPPASTTTTSGPPPGLPLLPLPTR